MIDMSATQTSPETLGAYLARIRPGDRCACCGAILQPVGGGRRMGRGPTGVSDVRPAQAVVCPDCGCEISEESGNDAEESRERLSPAA